MIFWLRLLPFILVAASSVFITHKITSSNCDARVSKMVANASEAQERAVKRAAATDKLHTEISRITAENSALKSQKLTVKERIVTKELIKYVKTPNAQSCGIDGNGLRVHNLAAASGGMPEAENPAAKSDDTGRTATNAEVLEVVTVNYAIYHATALRLAALQAWVRATQS